MANYTLNFDGSCGPKNPGGTAAYGYILTKEGETIDSGHGILGTGEGMTNNLAEFYALAMGLHSFHHNVPEPKGSILHVYGDSNLVIQIMNRHWRAKPDKPYYSAYDDALTRLLGLRNAGVTVFFDWIPREKNQMCDDLSKAHQKKIDKMSK
jgi:ribonuclease HI